VDFTSNIPNPKCHDVAECGELPYGTDPNYITMLSRAELLDPRTARQRQNKEAQTKALK
jgi:topoisomerase IA-like protein